MPGTRINSVRWVAAFAATVAVMGVVGTSSRGQEGNGKSAPAAPVDPPQRGKALSIDLPGVEAELLRPLRPCRTPVTSDGKTAGYVNWSAKRTVALGRAVCASTQAADVLMARRAATVIALRNVLAVCAGVRIAPDGRVDALRNGTVTLRGLVKDFTVTRTYHVIENQTHYECAEVDVPMYGVKSLAASFYDAALQCQKSLTQDMTRGQWAQPAAEDETAGDVLFLDARGSGLAPSLYPLVVSKSGKIILDAQTVGREAAINRGPCAYAHCDLTEDQLRSRVEAPPCSPLLAAVPGAAALNVDGMTLGRLLLGQVASQASSQPASAPAGQAASAPKRKRFVVRAAESQGKDKGVLVVDDANALKTLADPKASRLANSGRVVILVDAAAGGLEGLLPPPGAGTIVARR